MLKEIGKNTVKKGEVIFARGDALKQIGIVLSGKVLIQGDYIRMVRPQASYIALNEVGEEFYFATYTALEDSVIYALPVTGEDTIRNIISKNTDYRAIMISSQYKYAVELSRLKCSLAERAKRLYDFAVKSYAEYKTFCTTLAIPITAVAELEDLQAYHGAPEIGEEKLAYYEEGAKIPLAAHKQYYSYSEAMVIYQVNEIMGLVAAIREDCAGMTEYIRAVLNVIALQPRQNLYEYLCAKASELKKQGNLPIEMQVLLASIVEELRFQYGELQNQLPDMKDLDISTLENKMVNLHTVELTEKVQKTKEEREEEIRNDVASLKNSMDQIVKYGTISDEDEFALKRNVDYLVEAPDRLSIEDDVKKAKKAITPIVFKLYLSCYYRIKEGLIAPPKAVELFMNYGMLDERLLDQEHLEFLCSIEPEKNEGPCTVVTMMEWLDMIHDGRREPSKNDFDEDYGENLRTLKKQGDIDEKTYKALFNDMKKRVEYEVMNMQMSNSRSLYGQPTAYMPILYKEAIYGYLDQILVTKKKINDSVRKLMKIDYSVFYREVIYSNTKLKISNDTIMKNVYPDIILFPLYGLNASMWQEIGSRSKDTPGRFCFPILTITNIDDIMVKMFGRFRWELCRCIQGMAWNDIKLKSLTSEYMDYIQFYRKNHDLSDEAREKVKLQIQKGRNNSREIFLIDYEAWIKSEANGALKINKVARELLATYCPFEKSIREKLSAQRPYEVAMARGKRNALKKKQELELKIRTIQKTTSEIPEEIMETHGFYSEMC